MGAASIVLLKNVNNTLPLKKLNNLAVFGNDAGEPTNYLYSTNAYSYEYGTLPVGGGSVSKISEKYPLFRLIHKLRHFLGII